MMGYNGLLPLLIMTDSKFMIDILQVLYSLMGKQQVEKHM